MASLERELWSAMCIVQFSKSVYAREVHFYALLAKNMSMCWILLSTFSAFELTVYCFFWFSLMMVYFLVCLISDCKFIFGWFLINSENFTWGSFVSDVLASCRVLSLIYKSWAHGPFLRKQWVYPAVCHACLLLLPIRFQLTYLSVHGFLFIGIGLEDISVISYKCTIH